MKLTSRAGDYALLLLIELASLKGKQTSNVKKVAESLNLSTRFLANISNKLTTANLIVSTRGVGGGIRLAKPSFEISIREVIEAIEGPVQTMFCQNTHEICDFETLCSMKDFWSDIQSNVISKLEGTSIYDLTKGKTFVASEPMMV